MSTLYILESANLFCGDADPTKSKHLTIQELKLPALQAQYQDHMAGGAPVGIEIETGINKPEPSFKLVGHDPDLLRQFGLGSRIRHTYTAYSVVVDRKTGRKIERKAIIEGRLGKMEEDAFKKGDLIATDYSINEVMHYEVWFDKQEMLYWDFFTNTWRINGSDENSDTNRILRVTG